MSDEELIARLRKQSNSGRANHVSKADRLAAADRIEDLTKERDHWKDVAGREGVCMTCSGPNGAPEPYGCTDCFNTGYCGEHHNTVADLEAKLTKAMEALRGILKGDDMYPWRIAREVLAELEGK